MALQVFSPFGCFVVWAAFPFTNSEALHWIHYPNSKQDGARVFGAMSEDSAFALAKILSI